MSEAKVVELRKDAPCGICGGVSNTTSVVEIAGTMLEDHRHEPFRRIMIVGVREADDAVVWYTSNGAPAEFLGLLETAKLDYFRGTYEG